MELNYTINTAETQNKTKIDIIAITEHWYTTEEEKCFNFRDYNHAFSSRQSKIGGGACLLIKNNLQFNVIDTWNEEDNNLISIRLQITNTKTTIITCIYRRPDYTKEKVDEFLQKFDNHIHKHQHHDTYIIGDLNINLLNQNNITDQYSVY